MPLMLPKKTEADAAEFSSTSTSRCQAFCFLSVVLLLCYISVVYTTYGFSDDYTELLAHLTGSRYPWVFRLASGRPVDAVLNHLFFLLTSDIGSLRYLRLLAVIEVAGVAWMTYLTLRYAGWEWWLAICASLIIASLPPFQVYVSYTLTASYPVSIVRCWRGSVLCRTIDRARTSPTTFCSSIDSAAFSRCFELSARGYVLLGSCGYCDVRAQRQTDLRDRTLPLAFSDIYSSDGDRNVLVHPREEALRNGVHRS